MKTRLQANILFCSDEKMIHVRFDTVRKFKNFCRFNKESIESIDLVRVEHTYWNKEQCCEDWIECDISSQKYINLSDWVDNFNWTKKQEVTK